MSSPTATDLSVIIPTRDRWRILSRTLDALEHQTVTGFEVVVVVDGEDQTVPDVKADRVIVQPKAGPGVARNLGVAQTSRPLVMFLGDDIIPSPGLVERHLRIHAEQPDSAVAVLGHTRWHTDVAGGIHNRWLEWSASQFDFGGIRGDDAGWVRFYSSNVSLKRRLFLDAGGFDPSFSYDYEDLDFAYRLHQQDMQLRYDAEALGNHLHSYDWAGLVGRYQSRGQAERMMAEKNPWFEPFFAARLARAQMNRPASPLWPRLAALGLGPSGAQADLRRKATVWYHQHLAAPFFGAWNGQDDLAELREYLGPSFDEGRLVHHRHLVDEEEESAPDEAAFYRTSEAYLYDLTMFALWGTKEPYLATIRRLVPKDARLLDYGCGVGTDGLRLLGDGYDVAFADFDNPSTRYLKWRLDRRGSQAPVYDVDVDVPGGFDLAFCFDVIEHVDDPDAFLAGLEQRADLVMVNFLDPDPNDTHLHRPLPVRRLLNRATRRGLLFYHCYESRSHVVLYRSQPGRPIPTLSSARMRIRGEVDRLSERLTRLPPRHPH